MRHQVPCRISFLSESHIGYRLACRFGAFAFYIPSACPDFASTLDTLAQDKWRFVDALY